jgi:hypothetical protein
MKLLSYLEMYGFTMEDNLVNWAHLKEMIDELAVAMLPKHSLKIIVLAPNIN